MWVLGFVLPSSQFASLKGRGIVPLVGWNLWAAVSTVLTRPTLLPVYDNVLILSWNNFLHHSFYIKKCLPGCVLLSTSMSRIKTCQSDPMWTTSGPFRGIWQMCLLYELLYFVWQCWLCGWSVGRKGSKNNSAGTPKEKFMKDQTKLAPIHALTLFQTGSFFLANNI